MLLSELVSDPIVNQIVDNILSDETFKNKCQLNFDNIFLDNKITSDDIPIIINLVLTIYTNYTKIKINKKIMKSVFLLLMTKFINTVVTQRNGDKPDLDTESIYTLVEPQIDLLFLTLSTPCCTSCCGSRPNKDNEEFMISKLKNNYNEKQFNAPENSEN